MEELCFISDFFGSVNNEEAFLQRIKLQTHRPFYIRCAMGMCIALSGFKTGGIEIERRKEQQHIASMPFNPVNRINLGLKKPDVKIMS